MNISSKTLAASLGAVALAFAASSVQAESVDMAYTGMSFTGSHAAAVTGYSGSAGLMDFKVTNSSNTSITDNPILSFCVELTQFVTSSSVTYDVWRNNVGTNWTASVYDNLTKLFNNYYDLVKDNVTAAAMQLAVWEIVQNDDLNLGTGAFQASSAVGDAISTANGWLAGLASASSSGKYSVIKLTNAGAQDQVTVAVNEVPLPGAALLFLSALGLGGLARRKQSVAA